MNRICALIVVDAEGALSGGSASENSYLVDTNGFLGSWREGTSSLHTVCQDGQVVVWSVTPVSPGGDVSITGFSGAMVSSGACAPAADDDLGEGAWSGRVESRGAFQSYEYTVSLSVGGSPMSLSAFLKVV
ncbi:alpha-pore-forming tripartite toxin MakABE regulator [Sorangium sp. So ce854]|uniref:alpha-pore-forming tripartite toxin MakABE regulator n=1 Tax=Sorangium sp. So ce854 TaxID=3133322 RepID=UPI003F62C058